MMEFHLDRRSGLATYRQLELQVKQALRHELRRWVRKARDAGLDAAGMQAVLDHTIRDLLGEGVA
jgi:hypothetical protein